ncbi:MAG: hypothetical protein ABL888_07250 [Pirellulaceae bacterium]
MRYHAHYHTSGQGHVYEGRFKSFPTQDVEHFSRSPSWVERVNQALTDAELQVIRTAQRGNPLEM